MSIDFTKPLQTRNGRKLRLLCGEEMFKFHGYSCDCPKPPLPRPDRIRELEQQHKEQEAAILKIAKRMEKTIYPTILGSFAAELRAIFAPKEEK